VPDPFSPEASAVDNALGAPNGAPASTELQQ